MDRENTVTSLRSVVLLLWLSAKPRVYWTVRRGHANACLHRAGRDAQGMLLTSHQSLLTSHSRVSSPAAAALRLSESGSVNWESPRVFRVYDKEMAIRRLNS